MLEQAKKLQDLIDGDSNTDITSFLREISDDKLVELLLKNPQPSIEESGALYCGCNEKLEAIVKYVAFKGKASELYDRFKKLHPDSAEIAKKIADFGGVTIVDNAVKAVESVVQAVVQAVVPVVEKKKTVEQKPTVMQSFKFYMKDTLDSPEGLKMLSSACVCTFSLLSHFFRHQGVIKSLIDGICLATMAICIAKIAVEYDFGSKHNSDIKLSARE